MFASLRASCLRFGLRGRWQNARRFLRPRRSGTEQKREHHRRANQAH
jgi:hypothetical protein